MRTDWIKTLAMAALLASASVQAQDADLFTKLDKNGDGQVAADEVDDQGKRLFERLVRNGDENKDGKLSKEEFAAAMKSRPTAEAPAGDRPAGPRGNAEALFQRADANGDGKITKEEAPERLKQGFDRLDANSDGAIDKAEFARVAERLMNAGQTGRPAQPAPGAVGPIMRVLDADGDGELSASEIADAPKALAKIDKNNDGKVDRAELTALAPNAAGGGEGMLRRLQEADANGDNKISKEEAPERLKVIFDRIDANSDGQLERTEIREFFSRNRPDSP